MRCTCCGREISNKDKVCPTCGENNEGYVEIVEPQRQSYTQTYVNQPINRVPINPNVGAQNNQAPIYVYNQTQVVQQPKLENKTLGILAIVFSVLGGWVGLLLSIIGLCTYKEDENKLLCKIGLGLCIAWFVLGIIWFSWLFMIFI